MKKKSKRGISMQPPIDFATELYEKLNIKKIPVILTPILVTFGISYFLTSFLPPVIGLAHSGPPNLIMVDKRLTRSERRSTAAHECYHVLSHRGNHFFMERHSLQNVYIGRQEREADLFAAYYLIPEWGLQQVKEYWDDMYWLAEHFDVPVGLVELRLN